MYWRLNAIDNERPFMRVGTHSGKFHADEVMATAILMELFELEVVRSRDEKKLSELDIVYDVGGGQFDHHDVEKKYRDSGTPYAACGLVWNKYGREVIKAWDDTLEQEEIESVFYYVDRTLIEGIDAVDNGLKTSETIINTINFSGIISGFNPPWDSEKNHDEAFHHAVNFASSVLHNTLEQRMSVLRAKDQVMEAFNKRENPHLLVMDIFCPWGYVLKQIDKKKEVLFVIYPSREGFSISTVRKESGSLEARKDLPKAWAGKRDDELGEIIGVPDAIFCHPARFIAAARSFDSIMKMADNALAEPPDKITRRIFWLIRRLTHSKV